MRVWSGLFTIGGVLVCLFLIIQGFKFNSSYSILYIGTGLIFLPIMSYLTFWGLPGFKPGKILFKIIPGDNGEIISNKFTVPIRDIKEIDLERNRFTLYNNIVINTFNNRSFVIKTYNVLNDYRFYATIDEYVYPFLSVEAREIWDRRISNNQLLKDLNFERKHNMK